MAEAGEVQDESVITDRDVLIQVAFLALGEDLTAEKVLECLRDLGRGELIAQARETMTLMEMAATPPRARQDTPVTDPAPSEPATEAPAVAP